MTDPVLLIEDTLKRIVIIFPLSQPFSSILTPLIPEIGFKIPVWNGRAEWERQETGSAIMKSGHVKLSVPLPFRATPSYLFQRAPLSARLSVCLSVSQELSLSLLKFHFTIFLAVLPVAVVADNFMSVMSSNYLPQQLVPVSDCLSAYPPDCSSFFSVH